MATEPNAKHDGLPTLYYCEATGVFQMTNKVERDEYIMATNSLERPLNFNTASSILFRTRC